DPQKCESSAGVAAKIENQPFTTAQFLDAVVDLLGNVDTYCPRELRYLDPANSVCQPRDQHVPRFRRWRGCRRALVGLTVLEPCGQPLRDLLAAALVKKTGIRCSE